MQRKIQKTVHFLPGIFYIYQGFASENADYYTGFCSSYLKYKTEAFLFQKIFFPGGAFFFPNNPLFAFSPSIINKYKSGPTEIKSLTYVSKLKKDISGHPKEWISLYLQYPLQI